MTESPASTTADKVVIGQPSRDVGCVGAADRHDPVADSFELGEKIAAPSLSLLDRRGLEPDLRADRQPPERRA
jgi:hypothetical protein